MLDPEPLRHRFQWRLKDRVRDMCATHLPQLTAFAADGPTVGDAVAAVLGHGVKQPLTGMATSADAGLRWLDRSIPDVDEARAAFKQIAADARRMAVAIVSIQAILKVDAAHRTFADVGKLLSEALTLARDDLQMQAIEEMAAQDGPRILAIKPEAD
jgi:C4-dicarboxylate-specific signal transduction histidine kinase